MLNKTISAFLIFIVGISFGYAWAYQVYHIDIEKFSDIAKKYAYYEIIDETAGGKTFSMCLTIQGKDERCIQFIPRKDDSNFNVKLKGE